jgi:two-component system CheB/CheR fusion protein
MPAQLTAYVRELSHRPTVPAKARLAIPPQSLRQILNILRTRSGHDFTTYKPSTMHRRVQRRMNVHRIKAPDEYARFLRTNKQEASLLFRELLITVTSFFRDPEAFEILSEVLPDLVRSRPADQVLRVWVPGCATGEEAYSVAIVLHECMSRIEQMHDVQVFATDLDPAAIDNARAGIYPSGIAADVSRERLTRYFTQDEGSWKISKDIREMVIFAPQNVLSDPPFTRLDLIVCRNLLIYLDTEQQKRLLPTLHYALRPGGILFLGPAETIGTLDDLFEPIDRRWKIYRRREIRSHLHPGMLGMPAPPTRAPRETEAAADDERHQMPLIRSERTMQRVLLSRFAPTCVIVDESGDIIHIHGRTGMYLEPTEGEPHHNILFMAREGLAASLGAALRRAVHRKREVKQYNINVKTNGDHARVDVTVTPIEEPEALRGLLLVTFRPAHASAEKKHKRPPSGSEKGQARVTELEEELRRNRESLQSTVEELESSNEELKSANEELQSMNEELQSTNEELETSKEEMQSLNEELSTVNTELQAKVEELSHSNDDMQNLLNSIEVASVFLDEQLCIKRYTEQARELIHLVPGDVGRPLPDLAVHIECPALIDNCRRVLRTLERHKEEVRASDGTWLLMRILPYRTSANVIDGVVLTFVPIDELKRAEQQAQYALDYFEGIVQTVREPLLVLERDLTVRSANQAFYRTFDVRSDEIEGRRVYELGDGEWGIPRLRELLEEILPEDSAFQDFAVEHDFPRLGHRRFLLNARRLEAGPNVPELILLAMEDVTERES